MKSIISYSLLIIFFAIGCQEPVSSDNNQIVFRTKSNSYVTTDSIEVFIDNNMDSNFEIGLRCGEYLEMYYQKKDNNSWSNYLWFSWMSFKMRLRSR